MKFFIYVLLWGMATSVVACSASAPGQAVTESNVPAKMSDHTPGAAQNENKLPLPVWMEPPSVYGKILFSEELMPLSGALFNILPALADNTISVVPPDELQQLQQQIRLGNLPATDRKCDAPPVPMELLAYLHPGSGMVEPRISCNEADCEMTVVIYGPEYKSDKGYTKRDELMRFEGTLSTADNVEQWVSVLKNGALKKVVSESPQGGLGILSGIKPDSLKKGEYALLVDDVIQEGDWQKPVTEEKLKPHAAGLHQCTKMEARSNDSWLQPFQLEIDKSGKMIRCESKYQARLDPPKFQCQCEVLKKVKWGRSKNMRRIEFKLSTRLGGESSLLNLPTYTWVISSFDADDPSVLLSGSAYSNDSMSRCMTTLTKTTEWTVNLIAKVDSDGKVTHAEFTWPDSFTDLSIRKCVADVLQTARFNCPLTGYATVTGAVTIKTRIRNP